MSEATTTTAPQGSPGENLDTASTRLTVDQAHNLVDAELNKELIRRGLSAKGRRGERMKRLVASIRARDRRDEAEQAAAEDEKLMYTAATMTGEDTNQKQPPGEDLTAENPRGESSGDDFTAANPRGDEPAALESSQEGVAIKNLAAQASEQLDKELTEVLALDTEVTEKITVHEQQSEIAAQQDEARDNKTLAEATTTIQQEEERDRRLLGSFKAQMEELFDNRLASLQEKIDDRVDKAVQKQLLQLTTEIHRSHLDPMSKRLDDHFTIIDKKIVEGMDLRLKKINDDLAETYAKSIAGQEQNAKQLTAVTNLSNKLTTAESKLTAATLELESAKKTVDTAVADEKKQLNELITRAKTQVASSDALLKQVGTLQSLQNSVTSRQQEFTDLLKDMTSNKKQYDAIKRKIEDAAQVAETAATNATKEMEELKKLKLTKTSEASLSQQHLDLIQNLSTSISTITSDLTTLDEKVMKLKETPDPSIAKLTSDIATLEAALKRVTDSQNMTTDVKGVDALFDSVCDKLDLFQSKQEQELIETFKEEAASRRRGVEQKGLAWQKSIQKQGETLIQRLKDLHDVQMKELKTILESSKSDSRTDTRKSLGEDGQLYFGFEKADGKRTWCESTDTANKSRLTRNGWNMVWDSNSQQAILEWVRGAKVSALAQDKVSDQQSVASKDAAGTHADEVPPTSHVKIRTMPKNTYATKQRFFDHRWKEYEKTLEEQHQRNLQDEFESVCGVEAGNQPEQKKER